MPRGCEPLWREFSGVESGSGADDSQRDGGRDGGVRGGAEWLRRGVKPHGFHALVSPALPAPSVCHVVVARFNLAERPKVARRIGVSRATHGGGVNALVPQSSKRVSGD